MEKQEGKSMFKKYLRPLIAAILALILAIPLTIWNPGLALGNDGSKTLVPRNDGNETLVPGSGDNRTPALGNDNTQTSFHRAYDPKAIRLVVEVTQVADLDALAAAVGGELVRTGPLNYCTLEFRPESLKAENSHDPAVEPIITEEQKAFWLKFWISPES
jgi:hypothetical protein